jgi:hypothetical protein
MANKMDSVILIEWRLEKEEYDKSPLASFGPIQRWATFKNIVAIQPSQFIRWQLKFFSC